MLSLFKDHCAMPQFSFGSVPIFHYTGIFLLYLLTRCQWGPAFATTRATSKTSYTHNALAQRGDCRL